MIGVLLFILKCIGILLLALVCLLLLITLVVLLAPIRYEAGGEKTDAIRADGQVGGRSGNQRHSPETSTANSTARMSP